MLFERMIARGTKTPPQCCISSDLLPTPLDGYTLMDVGSGAKPIDSFTPLRSESEEHIIHSSLRDGEEGLQSLTDRLSRHLLDLVNSIEGYTDLLTGTLGTPEQRELSLRILEGTARIERIVSDLRRYSQPIQPVMRRFPVEHLPERLKALFSDEEWMRVGVEYAVDPAHELWADPMLIRQALLILVQNALEATSGEVSLTVAYREDREEMCFGVWNEGRVPVEDPEHKVFEPFFTTKSSNLGIGLPIAQHIADSHGGTIQLVSSTPEEGTRFELRVPQRDVHQADLMLDTARTEPEQ